MGKVVALVGVQLLGALAWATRTTSGPTDGRDGVEHSFKHVRIVEVGRCVRHCLRDTAMVVYKVSLGAQFATISGIGTSTSVSKTGG